MQRYELGREDRVIILASDGVWEFMNNQRAIDLVSQHTDASSASAALVAEASEQWRLHESGGRDDITALVLFLPCLPGQVDPYLDSETGPLEGYATEVIYEKSPLITPHSPPASPPKSPLVLSEAFEFSTPNASPTVPQKTRSASPPTLQLQ